MAPYSNLSGVMWTLILLILSVVASTIAVRRFLVTRQWSWLVGPVCWFALMVRHFFPNTLTTVAAGALLGGFVTARIWQGGAVKRWQRKHQAALPPLSKEQADYRKTLTADQQESLALFEMVIGERASEEKARLYFAESPPTPRDDNGQDDKFDPADEDEVAEMEAACLSKETQPRDSPVPVLFELGEVVTILTSEDAEFSLPPGPYEGTLTFDTPPPSSDERNEYLGAILWRFTCDAPNKELWQASGVLHGFVPLNLANLADVSEAPNSDETSGRPMNVPPPAVFWKEADREIRDSFAHRCLLKNLELADDARERFRIRVGGDWVCVHTKYLGWKVDLAVSGDRRRVWVRVVGMQRETWTHDPFSADEAEATKATPTGLVLTRAFVYPLKVEEFLPVCFPDRHWPSLDQMHADFISGETSEPVSMTRVSFSRCPSA